LGIKPAPPVFVAPDLVFASASYDAGAKVVRLVSDGDSVGAEDVWEHQLMRNHFNGSVDVDGHLCGFDKAFLKCIDAASGETTWTRRGFGKGSLIRADGKLVVLSERGKLALMRADASEPVELASHQVLTGRSWTQPALSNGRLYVRNASEMVALDLSDRTSDLVARYTEAVGGIENIRALESLRKTGTYVYNGLEHPIVVRQQRGAGSREDIEGLTAWGTQTVSGTTAIRAYDGQNAWTGRRDETLETRSMPAGEAAGFILDSDIEGSLVDYTAKGNAVEVIGATHVEGTPAMQVNVTLASGATEQWFLDSSSLLPIMKTTDVPDGEFKAAMTWYFDDYRTVAGVQMPFYVLVEELLFSREYLFDSIEVNVPTEPGLFTQPEGTEVAPRQ
jgi:outer membrane protein assembly factor BamB